MQKMDCDVPIRSITTRPMLPVHNAVTEKMQIIRKQLKTLKVLKGSCLCFVFVGNDQFFCPKRSRSITMEKILIEQ